MCFKGEIMYMKYFEGEIMLMLYFNEEITTLTIRNGCSLHKNTHFRMIQMST